MPCPRLPSARDDGCNLLFPYSDPKAYASSPRLLFQSFENTFRKLQNDCEATLLSPEVTCSTGNMGPESESGRDWARMGGASPQKAPFHGVLPPVPGQGGLAVLMGAKDLVGDKSYAVAFLSLLLALGKKGGFLFCPSINSPLHDKDSQSLRAAWVSRWSPGCSI